MGRRDDDLDAALDRARESWLPNSQKGGKATYDKSNVFGGSKHTEGKSAVRESQKDKKRW
jgi:hypothetical protein